MQPAHCAVARHACAHSRHLTYHRALLPPLLLISLQVRSSFSRWRRSRVPVERREGSWGRRRAAFQTRPHRRGAQPPCPRPSTCIDVPHQRGSSGERRIPRPDLHRTRPLVSCWCGQRRGVLLSGQEKDSQPSCNPFCCSCG